ncbi:MAG: hypothetical protein ACI9JN_001292 [Bacteroidia bacterium]|jgi:hypothetical protein
MDKYDETAKMIEQANNGVWFPVAIVGSLFLLMVSLLLYIWKQDKARNIELHSEHADRHKKSEDIILNLSENALTQAVLNTKLTMLIERNTEDIKEIKQRKVR